jgi:hypothetical protein
MVPTSFSATLNVRHVQVDGLRVILDLRTETYKVLDDVGSALWAVLIGETEAVSSYQDLSQRYDVDKGRFWADLEDFAKRCVEDGLLKRADSLSYYAEALPASPLPARATRPNTLGALLCLIATKRALARHGFRTTYERYARMSIGAGIPRLDVALSAFTKSENFFVARRAPNDCLLRSLALYRFLRSTHVAAEHVIGVRRFPFGAHAWVECDGLPVLDDGVDRFTPLARIRHSSGQLPRR